MWLAFQCASGIAEEAISLLFQIVSCLTSRFASWSAEENVDPRQPPLRPRRHFPLSFEEVREDTLHRIVPSTPPGPPSKAYAWERDRPGRLKSALDPRARHTLPQRGGESHGWEPPAFRRGPLIHLFCIGMGQAIQPKKERGWIQAVYPEGIWYHNGACPADFKPLPDRIHPEWRWRDSLRKVESSPCILSLDILPWGWLVADCPTLP